LPTSAVSGCDARELEKGDLLIRRDRVSCAFPLTDTIGKDLGMGITPLARSYLVDLFTACLPDCSSRMQIPRTWKLRDS
jgi:hypothetical protein